VVSAGFHGLLASSHSEQHRDDVRASKTRERETGDCDPTRRPRYRDRESRGTEYGARDNCAPRTESMRDAITQQAANGHRQRKTGVTESGQPLRIALLGG